LGLRLRARRLAWCAVAALIGASSACGRPDPAADAAGAAGPGGRPNIVFVLLDDVRFDDLGYAGHPFVRTPNIDRIAKEGVDFRNSFAVTPLCSPNRASILTGQYAHTHGITDNVDRSQLSHELITFPLLLQQAGYETAFIGKWHMGVDSTRRPGFDEWLSIQGQGEYFDPEVDDNGVVRRIQGYATDVFTDRSIEFIEAERDKPFLLYLSHKAVHPNIYQAADGSIKDIPPDGGFTPPARLKSAYAGAPVPRRPNTRTYAAGKPALLRPIEGLPPLGPATGTPDDVVLNRLRMLTAADEGLGRIIAALEKSNQLDNTLIVVTSDHGYFYGEHGLNEERRLAYEETARAPMAMRFPRMIPASTVAEEFVLSVDLAPTFLEIGGAKAPAGLHGRSLLPLMRGTSPADWRRSILIEYFSDKVWPRLKTMGYQAIRTERWKLIHYSELSGMDEMYDLVSDPFEITNVVDRPDAQAERARLLEELSQLLEDTGSRLRSPPAPGQGASDGS
jgi:N-acetylglucosamine-6-sulfatase